MYGTIIILPIWKYLLWRAMSFVTRIRNDVEREEAEKARSMNLLQRNRQNAKTIRNRLVAEHIARFATSEGVEWLELPISTFGRCFVIGDLVFKVEEKVYRPYTSLETGYTDVLRQHVISLVGVAVGREVATTQLCQLALLNYRSVKKAYTENKFDFDKEKVIALLQSRRDTPEG